MPLTKFVNERLAQLRAYLDDPAVAAVEVRVRDELKVMAAKLLVVAAEEGETFNLPIGVTAEFESADAFAELVAEAVAEEVELAEETLGDEQLAFPMPSGLRSEPAVPVEVRLVEYVEGVARAYANHLDRLVLVLDVAVPAELEPQWARFLARIVANTGPGAIVWVLFGGTDQLEAKPVPCHRWRAAVRPHGARLDQELETLARTPGARLLTLSELAITADRVAERMHELRAGTRPTAVVAVPPIEFLSPLYFYTEARRAVGRDFARLQARAGAGAHTAPLLEEAEASASYWDAERAFVEFCERLARAALRDGTQLMVVLSHAVSSDADEINASLRRLATAAVPARVKLVVLEPPTKPPCDPVAMRTAVFEFDFDPDTIERGLHERLKDDDLTALERLRYTTAVGGWALSKGEPHLAMLHSIDALKQAQAMDDPREVLAAYYNLGNTLYQCMEYEEAAKMYTEVAQTGMDEQQWTLAAQGLMGLGNTHFMREDPAQAEVCYEGAQALYEKQNLVHFEAHALTWRGEASVMDGRHGDALGFFELAVAKCDGMDPVYESTTRSTKADVLLRIARLYELSGQSKRQHDYEHQAKQLGATAPVCHHP